MGERRFAGYLRQTDAETKGVAIRERTDTGEGIAELVADLVYADGQEEHRFELQHSGSGWKITALIGSARHCSRIPYGTPVVTEPR
ncbi:MAG: hypothetical protein KKI08_02450 [Armatimonadetes bacterium]|nr:hypothetical protein [Armatimonadota bacterium]